MREGPWRDRTWLKKVQVKMISRQVIVPKAPSWPGGFISIIEANPGYAGMPRNSFLWTQIAWVSKFLNVISKELRHDISQPIGCFLRVDFAQDWSKNHPWTKDSLSDPTTIYKDWVTYIPKVVTQCYSRCLNKQQKNGTKTLWKVIHSDSISWMMWDFFSSFS